MDSGRRDSNRRRRSAACGACAGARVAVAGALAVTAGVVLRWLGGACARLRCGVAAAEGTRDQRKRFGDLAEGTGGPRGCLHRGVDVVLQGLELPHEVANGTLGVSTCLLVIRRRAVLLQDWLVDAGYTSESMVSHWNHNGNNTSPLISHRNPISSLHSNSIPMNWQ